VKDLQSLFRVSSPAPHRLCAHGCEGVLTTRSLHQDSLLCVAKVALRAMNKKHGFNALYVVFAIWGVMLAQSLWVSMTQISHISYSDFLAQLKAGAVEDLIVTDNQIRGHFKNPEKGKPGEFVTARMETDLAHELEPYNVKFTRVIENNFLETILSWTIPALVFFGIWALFIRRIQQRMSGGFMSIGKSKAKIYVEQDTKTTFADVAGVDEAKEELKEVVGFLKNPGDYGRLGARVPKGVLLVGPPGTGKTLMARAVAGEAGVPFFSISGSEFVELFVGLGAARVRDLFEQARGKAPCIIFIDELDALGKSRNNPMSGGHDEKEQTLNQLLVEMDGFDAASGIVLIGATNRPEILDPALLRAGRFDRQVLVDRPDRRGRVDILKVHAKKIQMEESLSLDQVADLTPGFTGADLANLVNEAAIVATRRKAEKVNLSDFTIAFERIIAGLERRNRLIDPREKRIVAFHEMGHALIAASLPGTDPVHKISIIPRGVGALGYTLQRPTGDRFLMTESELKNRMAVLLGGRAAELVVFEHLSTGAADDLVKATDIARSMVARYGMDEKLGSITYDFDNPGFLGPNETQYLKRRHSDETARELDVSVKNLIENELERAIHVLATNREVLNEGAELLLSKETLEQKDLAGLFAKLNVSKKDLGNTFVIGKATGPDITPSL
jgi:cell division protease FtsH